MPFEPRPLPSPRSVYLTFRVTPQERALVQTAASDAGLSIAELVRRALARETSGVGERDEEAVAA